MIVMTLSTGITVVLNLDVWPVGRELTIPLRMGPKLGFKLFIKDARQIIFPTKAISVGSS